MMSSRMNSARAAKTWTTSRPAGGGGVERFLEGTEADAALAGVGDDRDEVLEGTGEPVERGDDGGVAGPHVVKGLPKFFALDVALLALGSSPQ